MSFVSRARSARAACCRWLLFVVWLPACAAQRPANPPPPEPTPTAAAQALERAGELRATNPKEAAEIYRKIVRESPQDPATVEALWELAQLQVDPQSPVFDYAGARRSFAKLCTTYRDQAGPHLRPAEAWRAVLRRLSETQARASKLEGKLGRLRGDVEAERDKRLGAEGKLDRLKELDMEEDLQP